LRYSTTINTDHQHHHYGIVLFQFYFYCENSFIVDIIIHGIAIMVYYKAMTKYVAAFYVKSRN